MKEIGSEFEYCELDNNKRTAIDFLDVEDYGYCFSGRTAIETVLKDIGPVKKACLPSYCCDSMIEPFRKQGIEVCFYSVYYENELVIKYNFPDDCQIVLFCNYFGFETPFLPDDFVEEFHSKGGYIIEDITHSFLSIPQKHSQSDYYVVSLRKWFPICSGGLFMKRIGRIKNKPVLQPGIEFIEKKLAAMCLKKKYIDAGNIGDKNKFLELYETTNNWFAKNYSNMSIDEQSMNYLESNQYEIVAKKRIENATVLYDALDRIKDISLLFDREKMRCPLFVPIIVNPECRGEIRSKLIENAIYCPIHWPNPNADCNSNLYDMELSLICDQRYDEKDMMRIVQIISQKEG